MRKIATVDLERSARQWNTRAGLKREVTANPMYSETCDNGNIQVEYWKRSDFGESHWNYSVVDCVSGKEWAGNTLIELRRNVLRRIIIAEFSGSSFWYQTTILDAVHVDSREVVLPLPHETNSDAYDNQDLDVECKNAMKKVTASITGAVKVMDSLGVTFINARNALAAIAMLAMVSCSNPKEQVTINKNSSNFSEKATAISMVVVEPEVKIGTIMIYRPHKIFSMPKVELKPLPRSRHSIPGIMLLLNGSGYENQ